jgi:long-chain acyl-CoA synthetase
MNADDIIAYCKDKLPATAVPKFVEFRDELPLTVTDKIFKRFLREEEIKRMKEQGVLK